jgi:hypothetical protein
VIDTTWKSDTCTSIHWLEKKLKGLSGSLLVWGRDTFGSVRRELKQLRHQLVDLCAASNRLGPNHQELMVVERLVELQHREEVMWRQRSRGHWLVEGDQNTPFFSYACE